MNHILTSNSTDEELRDELLEQLREAKEQLNTASILVSDIELAIKEEPWQKPNS